MYQSAAAQGDPYQAAHYSTTASPPTMYSGQPPPPPSYSSQPLQPPPMVAASAPSAAWAYPPHAGYEAAPNAHGQPMAGGAYPQSCAPGYAPVFHPAHAYYQPPQQSVNVALSTAPSTIVVHQPAPVTTLSVVKSYLAWSLVSLIILCWPLGIPALIYSLKVKNSTTLADKSKYSMMARNFNIAATVVGPVLILVLASSIGTVRTTYYTYYYYYYNSYYSYYYYG